MGSRKKSSKRVIEDLDSSSVDEQDYHVEVFYGVKSGDKRGDWEYRVKESPRILWAYYEEDACTWEPEENVKDCTRLLDSFWAHVQEIHNLSRSKWKAGVEVQPTGEWIEKEKKYFREEVSKEDEDKEVEGDQPKEKKNPHRNNKKQEKLSTVAKDKEKKVSSESEEDTPLISLSKKAKGKRKALSASSDSDDQPLISASNSLKRAASSASVRAAPLKKLKYETRKATEKDAAVGKELFADDMVSGKSDSEPSRTPVKQKQSKIPPASHQGITTSQLGTPSFKMPALPEKSGTVGSSLSTKARLSQVGTILQPANAKSLPKFTKRKLSTSAASTPTLGPREETLWNQAQQAKEMQSPPATPTIPASVSSRIKPPRPADLVQKLPTPRLSPNILKSPVPMASSSASTTTSPLAQQVDYNAQALELLSDIMPEGLKSSLDVPAEEARDEVLPPQTSLISKPRTTPQTQPSRIWSWTGEMYWGVKTSESRPQCKITVKEPSPARLSSKLEFRWAMQDSIGSINFERLYGVHDIELLLPMWTPVQQFAKVVPSEDATPLNTLAVHMTIKNCFACAPITDNGVDIAHIVLFSSESRYLVNRLRCPTTYKSCLILALFNLRDILMRKGQGEMTLQDLQIPVKDTQDKVSSFADEPRWNELNQRRPVFARAIRALEFPKSLWDHLSQPRRSYYVWDNMSDSNVLPDTRMLLAILAETGAKRVDSTSPCRVVFIHVSALKSLINASPSALQRTSSHPEVDFYIYGSHQSLPRRLWGVQNIFPIGGIVTFTPEFLKERPLAALEIVKKIHEHELWACYVLPVVLGRAVTLATGDNKQLSAFDDLPLRGFLQAIEEGQVAFMQSPSSMNSAGEWISAQARTLTFQTRGILEDSVRLYEKFKEPIASDYRTVASLETLISKDLCNIRIEPGIIDKYRRFVVISHSGRLSDRAKDGLEWLTLEQFSFKDNFFATS